MFLLLLCPFVPFLRGGHVSFLHGGHVHFISGRGGERVGMKKLSRRAVSSDL